MPFYLNNIQQGITVTYGSKQQSNNMPASNMGLMFDIQDFSMQSPCFQQLNESERLASSSFVKEAKLQKDL